MAIEGGPNVGILVAVVAVVGGLMTCSVTVGSLFWAAGEWRSETKAIQAQGQRQAAEIDSRLERREARADEVRRAQINLILEVRERAIYNDARIDAYHGGENPDGTHRKPFDPADTLALEDEAMREGRSGPDAAGRSGGDRGLLRELE